MSVIEKKLFAFDLDGTLSESKSSMDAEMADLIDRLLHHRMMAIISGGAFEQFQRQLPALKSAPEQLKNLFFFPTTGTRFYRYEGNDWQQVYADELTAEERAKIKDAFEKAFEDIAYKHPETLYGEVVEDRGTQITFSAVGQQAPLEAKKLWKETQDRRPEIVQALQKYIPEFEAKMPGVTSIDVTRKGIDKAYGILKIEEYLGVKPSEIIFTGDALFEGGNDHAVIRTGVDTQAVTSPEDTKMHLRAWLAEIEA